MPIIDGIFCFIHTSEGPLKEYPCVDGPLPNSASVYVVAQDGQQFFIKCSAPSPHKHMPIASTDGLSIQLQIDGVNEQPMLLDHISPTITINGTRVCTTTGNWELRKFMFSSVELTEERDRGELTLENVNKLGEIVVTVRRFRKSGVGGASKGGASKGGADVASKRTIIHEKAIKGRDISHSVQRAKGEHCRPLSTTSGIYLDPISPLMNFRFLYKSERALKNMGLIERSPSPPPHLLTERNPSPARSRASKTEHNTVKRERNSSAGPSVRSKVPRRQDVRLDEIETVDLTGDD